MNILYIIAIILGTMYIGSPILIYFVFRANENPNLNLFDPYQSQMPRLEWDFFCSTYNGLQNAGFELAAYIRGNVSGSTTYLMILQNPRECDYVMVASVFNQNFSKRYVEFCTEYENGQEINTSNLKMIGCFGKNPGKIVNRFIKISDTYSLYEIHKAILKRTQIPYSKLFNSPETALQRLKEGMKKEYDYQVNIGYLTFNMNTRKYRPTLKGAFLMTWTQLFPVKQIMMMFNGFKADRLLKSIINEQGVQIK